ncbi:MAG: DUF1573 domain-containing protein [Muribaculaceae bacterium]|nr:DUF1573 domain-containing protein [Muribaculaceae bacterium]
MKLLIYPLLSFCALSASAQVEWLETEHNFGAFRESDGKASCVFRFVNHGNEPVAITGARANCGCTSPQYPIEAIAPGDTAAVTVAYDPAGRPGRFTKYVQVDVSGEAKKRLSITGVVIGEPSSIGTQYPVDFGVLRLRRGAVLVGQVDKGKLKTASVSMYNTTADSLRPRFDIPADYIDVAMVPDVIPPGEQATMTLYFRSGKCPLYGLVENSITVIPQPINEPDSVYELPVTAIVNEDFSRLTPEQMKKAPVAALESRSLDFGTVAAEGELSGSVRITNKGQNTLYIRRVYSTDPGIKAEVAKTEVKKGRSTDIMVSVDPAAISGKLLNAKISVITSDPLNPVQTLRVTGILDR